MHLKMLQPGILKLGHVIVHSIGVTLVAHEIDRLGLSPYVECHRLTNPASA